MKTPTDEDIERLLLKFNTAYHYIGQPWTVERQKKLRDRYVRKFKKLFQ